MCIEKERTRSDGILLNERQRNQQSRRVVAMRASKDCLHAPQISEGLNSIMDMIVYVQQYFIGKIVFV